MKRCIRCVVPETYPGVSFDERGVCNFCNATRHQEPIGEEALLRKLSSKKGSRYDCVLGISGGKDSCYVAYLARKRYGLKAVAVCYDFPFMRNLARQNVRNVCRALDLELVVVHSKNRLEYDLLRNHLMSLAPTGTTWGQCIFCHYGIDAILHATAREKDAPFILSGTTSSELWWNPGNRTHLLMRHVKSLPLKELMQFARYQLKAYANLVDQRRQFKLPGNRLLDVYRHPLWPRDGPEQVRVFEYVRWDHRTMERTLTEETGWVRPEDSCSWRYDCILEPLLDFTYMKEFGISTSGLYLSSLIRSGLMGRDEAMAILEEREDRTRLDRELRHVLDFLDVPSDIRKQYLQADVEPGD